MAFTFRQLHHFIAIAETGQISRAATRCHISQSSMTISLKNLEEVLGLPLFTRHPDGLRLNDAGEKFLRHANALVNAAAYAIDELHHVPEKMVGKLTIGVTETISAYFIPAFLNVVTRRFPHLKIKIVEYSQPILEDALQAGQFDFAILLVSNLRLVEKFEYETLIRSPRKLWLHPSHPLLSREQVRLSDVAEEDYVLLDMDEHISTVEKYWGHYGLRPTVMYQSRSIEAVRSLVAMGHGATILSDLVYRPWTLEGNRIVRKTLIDPIPSMDVGVAWSKDREIPKNLAEMVEYLRLSMRLMSDQIS